MEQETISRLTFDEAHHHYFLDGRPIANVTTILDDVGLKVFPDWITDREWYAQRGKMVHKACDLLDAGILKESSLDERIVGYVEAYKKAKAELNFTVIESELRVVNESYWYAGTLDKYVVLADNTPAIIDLKSGAPNSGDRYQTAGYSYAFGSYATTKRFCLYLKEDGVFRHSRDFKEHDDLDDITVFQSACNVYHAKYGR